jgi:hypothetical protein
LVALLAARSKRDREKKTGRSDDADIVVANICTLTGWGWEYVEDRPVYQIRALMRVWNELCPPVAWSAAAQTQFKPSYRAEGDARVHTKPEHFFAPWGIKTNNSGHEPEMKSKIIDFHAKAA